jgi:hypothetical protein
VAALAVAWIAASAVLLALALWTLARGNVRDGRSGVAAGVLIAAAIIALAGFWLTR